MKAWKLVITVVLCITVLLPAGRSVESPVTRNPAGYSTIPQSSFRSGLVNTPNPIDPTGNLVMTGNVRRGMHFRGSIPYQSTTSFNATLGSSALNSFLRDTAGSEDFIDRSNKYRVQPFYSPTQTVTTMVPGRSEVFNSMSIRIDDRVRQGAFFVGDGLLGLDSSPRGHTSLSQDASTGDSNIQEFQSRYPSTPLRVSFDSTQDQESSYRAESHHERNRGVEPIDQSLDSAPDDEHVEPLVPGQLGIRQVHDGSAGRSALPAGDVSRGSSSQENLPASSMRRPTKDNLTQYPGEEVRLENLKSRREMLDLGNSVDTERPVAEISGVSTSDQTTPPISVESLRSKTQAPWLESDERQEILEQIRRQLDALTKSVEAGLQEDTKSIFDTQYSMLDGRESGIENLGSVDSRLSPGMKIRTNPALKSPESVGDVGILSMVSSLDELKDRRKQNLSANADQMKEPYKSLESFSQSRFNRHLSSANDHLKAGRYYRAVDSFTLASVYQPNNPDILSGKGHALFAAGEYMSSALFLARALAIRSDYTQTKVDLAAMLGGADKLTERIADVEQWLARSGSAQLQFLLSYVYFHTGRLNQAKQPIAAAYEKMSDSPAVVTLRTVINQAAK